MAKRSMVDYDIWINEIDETHCNWLKSRQYAGIVVLCDENTHRDCWPRIEPLFRAFNPKMIVVPAGELHKNIDTCQTIWKALFEAGAGRNWCMLNLGGGVIGDMGGFCAGTFKRGMDFIQIPTTLLSQVDASVGGKLGIDFYQVKNSIGLFQNPAAVWADARFFETLPARELRSGFAEILKHALIADAQQWEDLKQIEDLSTVNWSEWVDRSVTVKQHIVEADPLEKGLRKALNFGHTIGHAIESYFLETETPLLHGEAIAVGMICEAFLSIEKCGLTVQDCNEIAKHFISVYGHKQIPLSQINRFEALMRQDKKNEADEINFSLLSAIGQCKVNQTASIDTITAAIQFYNDAWQSKENQPVNS